MTTKRVELHPLTFVQDGDEVVVGRPDIESYAVFPVDGAELLRRLEGGSSLDEAAAWSERTSLEPVDVEEFLDTLRDLGFARDGGEADPVPAGPPDRLGTADRPIRWQRFGQAVFSPAAAAGYGLLVLAAIVLAWRWPEVRPTPSHVFFTGSLVLVQLALVVGELPLIFLHEGAHVLAGRRLGLTSRLGVGRRLYFVVFETTLTKLLSVPRRKRYLPLAAGMLTDVVVCAALVLVAVAGRGPDGAVSFLGRFALGLAYLTIIRIVWQFLFFMETDGHHLLATMLKVTDLHGMTVGYLRRWLFGRVLRKPERVGPLPYLSEHDRAVLRWFGPLTLIASVLLTALALATVLPVLIVYLGKVAAGLVSSGLGVDFWNAVGSLLLGFGQFGVLGALALRDRRRRRRAAASTASAASAAELTVPN
ncbi:MAG TPA: PqqD family protein [Mycobacteriales bacterium]|nr:PqqD family protein [Mycobacteriales bacterium]